MAEKFNASSFSSTSSLKSEAPEDQLMFQLLENSRSNLYYQTNKALKSREFWKLIDEVERLVQFSVNSFGGNGLAASYLVSSLMKLRIGRESILIPLATHVIHCMKNNQMDIQSAIYIANGITSLASKEIHQDPQILSFMDHTNLFVQEYIKNNNDTHEIETNQLIILLHAGLKIDRFYEPLGQILFERLQNEKQWKEFYSNCSSSSIRLNRFLKYLYQLHLDGILHKKHHHHLYFYDLKIQE
jgi:hypothetical protein